MHIFYQPEISNHFLSEEESWHCAKVLRLNATARAIVIDGKGGTYEVVLEEVHPKKCSFSILKETREQARDYVIHIAIAPTKNIDRIEFFVEKAIEFGIDEITFLKCDRSERKEVKLDRIEKIAIAAVKQSMKAFVPIINPVISFKDFVKNEAKEQSKFIAYLADEERKELSQSIKKKGHTLILIGPEGDFTKEEVALAFSKGFEPASLGTSRLRTETAGLAACHTVHVINQL